MQENKFGFGSAIVSPEPTHITSANEFENGPKQNPLKLIQTYEDDEWEAFANEWVRSLESKYTSVERLSGAGDKGIDIAGFTDVDRLDGIWDNYQCKAYARALSFKDVAPDIGKILWHSYSKIYAVPRSCSFLAPKGASSSLLLLLNSATNLKSKIINEWDAKISKKITSTPVKLDGAFLSYVNKFDFSIFQAIPPLEVIVSLPPITGPRIL